MSRSRTRPAWPPALLGSSGAARQLRDSFSRAARPESRTLIVAAPGMDDGSIARAIHARDRSSTPLVEVNCASSEPAVVEATLLGRPTKRVNGTIEHVDAGAALARARHGTCVLTSVDDLSDRAQARLARALRDDEVRIGTGGAVPLRLRLVAVAGQTLDEDVARGHFRADLRRRLGVVRLDLLPLSERREDIGDILIGQMAQSAAVRHASPRPFTDAAIALIVALQWPDNVAALFRMVESLVEQGSAPVRVEEVLGHLGAPGSSTIGPQASLRDARRQFEREYISAVLRRYDGRIAPAARALGIQRTNLYRKARQLGLAGGGRAG